MPGTEYCIEYMGINLTDNSRDEVAEVPSQPWPCYIYEPNVQTLDIVLRNKQLVRLFD